MTSIVAKVASKNKRHKKRRVDDTFYPTHLPRARCTCFVSLTLTEVFGGGLKIDPAKRHLKAIQIHSRMKAAKKTPRITLIFVSKPSKARKLWLTAPLSTSHYISKKDCLGFDPLSPGIFFFLLCCSLNKRRENFDKFTPSFWQVIKILSLDPPLSADAAGRCFT